MWAKPTKTAATKGTDDRKIIAFATSEKFRTWLLKNSATSPGIWIRFFKKASGKKTVTYAEALDEALCFGWIDSQTAKFDDESYLQKFTPRRVRSLWSKRNREHVARLIKEKRMTAAGVAEIKRAKADGRWAAAYDGPSTAEIPEDFLKVLNKNKKAKTFFETLNKANQYAITWRLQTAKKPETRAKRLALIIEKLARGEKFH